MLEHHEEQALAEIEAHLHAEDPLLSDALDAGVPRTRHAVTRVVTSVVAVLLLISVSTWALGPDLGALIAVVGLSATFLYGWQTLRVCRGMRSHPSRPGGPATTDHD